MPAEPLTALPARRFPFWLRLFEPAPPAAESITDPAAVELSYRAWRRRILFSTIVGYGVFYFVRKNLSVAMPAMERDLGINKASLGLFLTLHGVLYGVSKFANGFLGDQSNARAFMVVGLFFSALINVFFGFSSAVVAFGLFWMLNGWFQGMGFPPCARLLTHWFSPKDLATKWSIWNMSHSLGAALILILCGFLVVINWRLCFLVPAAIAFVCVIFLSLTLPDTPPSVGLPELEGTQSVQDELESEFFHVLVIKKVFGNPYIWVVSVANFFVYILRYAVLDWGPTLLTQTKHIHITHASWMVAGFEFAGAVGAMIAGWMSDRFFGGRPARACLIYMGLAGVALFLFWKNPFPSELVNATLLCGAGFFIYGPQCLVATIAANLATKRAAASAVGLTGIFGYASTTLSGWGLGALVEYKGWDIGFAGLLIVAALGVVLFAFAWGAKPHGYDSLKD
jgi:OPA family glycerol-3-phosphate transporter-like MFS transporter/OPA family sugar phosphate sensor protein UhpC-like MFS transporter